MTTHNVVEFNRWLRDLGFEYNPFILGRAEDYLNTNQPETLIDHFVPVGDYQQSQFPHIAIVAPTGSGKTTHRIRLAEKLCEDSQNFVVCYTTSFIPNPLDKETLRRIRSASTMEHYNVEAIRRLLHAAFTVKELRRFWWDRPTFRPVLDLVNEGDSLADHVDRLIIYCYKRLLFPELFTEIERYNPRQYANYKAQLQDEKATLPPNVLESPFQNIPASRLVEPSVLRRELDLAQRLGFGQIYILLDGLDEQKDPVLKNIVTFLLSQQDPFEVENLHFRLFLPSNFRDRVKRSPAYQRDLLTLYNIRWTRGSLRRLLDQRLRWASQNRIASLAQIAKEGDDLGTKLIELAITSPAPPWSLLQLGQSLFQIRFASRAAGIRLERQDWDKLEQQWKEHANYVGPKLPNTVSFPTRLGYISIQIGMAGKNKLSGSWWEGRPSDRPVNRNPLPEHELPFSGAELDIVLKALTVHRTEFNFHKVFSREEEAFLRERRWLTGENILVDDLEDQVGQRLYSLLAHDELVNVLEQHRTSDSKDPRPCALVCPQDIPLLARYPWELIHAGRNLHLFRSRLLQLVRYIENTEARPVGIQSDRLNILYIAPRPRQHAAIGYSELLSIDKILDPLDVFHYEPLYPPTFHRLIERLQNRDQPIHFIHFDGHGGLGRKCRCGTITWDSQSDRCSNPGCDLPLTRQLAPFKGYLVFEDKWQKEDGVSAEDLGDVLAGYSVRGILLSACRSAAVPVTGFFNSVAPRLLLSGLSGVVGMQLPITINVGREFSTAFYREFAHSGSLLSATAAGRQALIGMDIECWYVPTLYLPIGSEGQILSIKSKEV